jgi:hypothetical protein
MSGLYSDHNRVVPGRLAYPDANSHRNTDGHGYGYGYSDSQTYAYAAFNADPEAASYSGAASDLKIIPNTDQL